MNGRYAECTVVLLGVVSVESRTRTLRVGSVGRSLDRDSFSRRRCRQIPQVNGTETLPKVIIHTKEMSIGGPASDRSMSQRANQIIGPIARMLRTAIFRRCRWVNSPLAPLMAR